MASAKKRKGKQSKSFEPDEVSLRAVTKADTEFLFRVYTGTRDEEMQATGWSEEEKEKFLRNQFDAQQKHYKFYYSKARFDIILFRNQPIGNMYVDRGSKEMLGVDISILPEYRSKGIGGFLIRELLVEAERKGVPFNIQVLKNNSKALKLYERMGFVYDGESGIHFKMRWNGENESES